MLKKKWKRATAGTFLTAALLAGCSEEPMNEEENEMEEEMPEEEQGEQEEED